jgi:hypothetical protein
MASKQRTPNAGAILPTSDEGPTVAAVAPQQNAQINAPDFHSTTLAGQALRAIEGEHKAAQYLARFHAQQADPDELALIVSMLYGATLRGFCRVIEKALGVHHA